MRGEITLFWGGGGGGEWPATYAPQCSIVNPKSGHWNNYLEKQDDHMGC